MWSVLFLLRRARRIFRLEQGEYVVASYTRDRNLLGPALFARHDSNSGERDRQPLRQKPAQGFVGAIFDRRGGEAHFQCASVFAFDGIAAGARGNAHRKGNASPRFFDFHPDGLRGVAAQIRDGARAKQRGAGANFRGALFDGDFEIVTHAHGQNWKRLGDAPGHFFPKFGELAKKWANFFGTLEERWNGHQPAQLQIWKSADAFRQRGKVRLRNSTFGGLVAQMNFDQYAELLVFRRRGGVEALRESQAIDGIDAIEQPRGARGFVALQVADQVPRRAEIRQRRGFALEFLNAILAKVTQAGFVRGKYGLGRMCFGNRNDGDFLGPPAGALRRASDALADLRQIGGDGGGRVGHGGILALWLRGDLGA